jgi:hypothetical protein
MYGICLHISSASHRNVWHLAVGSRSSTIQSVVTCCSSVEMSVC